MLTSSVEIAFVLGAIVPNIIEELVLALAGIVLVLGAIVNGLVGILVKQAVLNDEFVIECCTIHEIRFSGHSMRIIAGSRALHVFSVDSNIGCVVMSIG